MTATTDDASHPFEGTVERPFYRTVLAPDSVRYKTELERLLNRMLDDGYELVAQVHSAACLDDRRLVFKLRGDHDE